MIKKIFLKMWVRLKKEKEENRQEMKDNMGELLPPPGLRRPEEEAVTEIWDPCSGFPCSKL